MRYSGMRMVVCLCLFLGAIASLAEAANDEADAASSQRIIVKWKDDGRTQAQALADIRQRFRSAVDVDLQHAHSVGNRSEVLRTARRLSDVELRAALDNLNASATVEYAVLDQRRRAHSTIPSDPYFVTTSGRTGQWYLQATEPAALKAVDAWDYARGDGVVVAVLDTGVRSDHPDLSAKLLSGYDFVSGESSTSFLTANDGDGWDADASDPGDWISASDRQKSTFSSCDVADSSWHGTRTAGIIGAKTNNAAGIAGTGFNASILPVRVLGKCGGWDSDIISAMRWAAGLTVSGAPTNTHPAKIINLSLGSEGACTQAFQDVIDELWSHGVVVVSSAGNDGKSTNAPANCEQAIAVAGIRHEGDKVGYSSLGADITIAAPAGNCVNTSGSCLYSIDTTYNLGTTTPATNSYTDQNAYNVGTSFSAPLVSGVIALMRSANSTLTAEQTVSLLRSSASAFPTVSSTTCHVPTGSNDVQDTQCNCTTATCGAGMLNAQAAVLAATNTTSYTVGGTVNDLQGSGLTLRNNGSDSLAIGANGSFVFATALASGSSYDVTVQVQPTNPTQACAITSATGTIGSANIGNITVSCTTSSYTVGGIVTGLSGSGLVLQNSGGNDLAITSSGSFTFSTAVASGSTYSVTVKTQPSSQSCTASNASGTVSSTAVGNVAVTCTTSSSSSGNSGGGGSLGWYTLLALALSIGLSGLRHAQRLEERGSARSRHGTGPFDLQGDCDGARLGSARAPR